MGWGRGEQKSACGGLEGIRGGYSAGAPRAATALGRWSWGGRTRARERGRGGRGRARGQRTGEGGASQMSKVWQGRGPPGGVGPAQSSEGGLEGSEVEAGSQLGCPQTCFHLLVHSHPVTSPAVSRALTGGLWTHMCWKMTADPMLLTVSGVQHVTVPWGLLLRPQRVHPAVFMSPPSPSPQACHLSLPMGSFCLLSDQWHSWPLPREQGFSRGFGDMEISFADIPGEAAVTRGTRVPTTALAGTLRKCPGGHLLPPAPLPASFLAWPPASALSGLSGGTAGSCHVPAASPVPCISASVLNSLSEQLAEHMGLYGVGCMLL